MRTLTQKQLMDATGAEALSSKTVAFSGIGTDTRQNLRGQLFIALKGEAFDAHQFLDKAAEQGAAALLVHEKSPRVLELAKKLSVYFVPDTLRALQQLATWSRRQSRAQILGITGSNGKTTTKEFTAALIGSCRRVHYNEGSFNNHWGVPFTLLQLPQDCDVAVVEMGMNHAGEITELVRITEPNVVVCTTVGRAHIEFFGTIEKIAEAKSEIYKAAGLRVRRIYNLDNKHTHNMYVDALGEYPKEGILTFSAEDPRADVHLILESMTLKEMKIKGIIGGVQGEARVSVFGRQNMTNLMAAATLGLAADLSPKEVWAGLPHCKTNWGRNQLVALKSGAQMIFDAYNANPDSMKALIENVKSLKLDGKKVGVFGQMRELGPTSSELHKELATFAGEAGYERIYFIGEDWKSFQDGLEQVQFKGFSSASADFSVQMAQDLGAHLSSGDLVTLKASRGTKLERFVSYCEPLEFAPKD